MPTARQPIQIHDVVFNPNSFRDARMLPPRGQNGQAGYHVRCVFWRNTSTSRSGLSTRSSLRPQKIFPFRQISLTGQNRQTTPDPPRRTPRRNSRRAWGVNILRHRKNQGHLAFPDRAEDRCANGANRAGPNLPGQWKVWGRISTRQAARSRRRAPAGFCKSCAGLWKNWGDARTGSFGGQLFSTRPNSRTDSGAARCRWLLLWEPQPAPLGRGSPSACLTPNRLPKAGRGVSF